MILPAFRELGLDPANLDFVLNTHADVDHFGGNAAIRAAVAVVGDGFRKRAVQRFHAVAKQLSFTKAAEALFMTQPAVTFQIKQLEDELGQPLFERIDKKVVTTEAGELLRGGNAGSRPLYAAAAVNLGSVAPTRAAPSRTGSATCG